MSHNRYKAHDWNALCDSCGFKFKASELKKRWDGLMVDEGCWEERNPQDFLRARKERSNTLPWTRPFDGSELVTPIQNLYVDFNYWEEIILGPTDQWYVAPE